MSRALDKTTQERSEPRNRAGSGDSFGHTQRILQRFEGELCAFRARGDSAEVKVAFKKYYLQPQDHATTVALVVKYLELCPEAAGQDEFLKNDVLSIPGLRDAVTKNSPYLRPEDERDTSDSISESQSRCTRQPRGFEALGQKKADLSNVLDRARLTNRQYEVASLRFEYQLELAEIGTRLGIHHSTVQEHIEAAKKQPLSHPAKNICLYFKYLVPRITPHAGTKGECACQRWSAPGEHMPILRYPLLKISIIESGKPQYRVAFEAGLDPWTFGRVIRGDREVTDQEKKRIAKALGREAAQLFTPAAERSAGQ